MIDIITHEQLVVETAKDSPSYIRVFVKQLEQVCRLLDDHDVAYWVDPVAVSLDGEPEVTIINISRNTDPQQVQRILDGTP